MNIWQVLCNKPTEDKDILRSIVHLRHIDKKHIRDYLDCNVPTHDAYLLRNMKEAVHKINEYKNITIFGDSDCDGVSATAIMYIGLKALGKFNVHYQLPLRQEGYGLSNKAIDQAKMDGADLIITVDNGITAIDEVNYAKSLGIDMIVTDHHLPLIIDGQMKLPDCLTIDPQTDDYPFKFICGACVAFKFIEKLFLVNGIDLMKDKPALYDELLCINAIATVADVMQIIDENRYYVGIGLKKLAETKNEGLNALIKAIAPIELTSETIGFQIGPTINAAGRLETPYKALDLLLAEDINDCIRLSRQLIDLNTKRKKLQREAVLRIPENLVNDDFIVYYDPDIHKGILGTVASSLVEKYKKPCFVLGGKEKLAGSGRSIGYYSLLDFIQTSRDIIDGGGHASAAGISIDEEQLDELKRRANEHYAAWCKVNNKGLDHVLQIVCELDFNLISLNLAKNLAMLAPFGTGNTKPLFMTQDVNVLEGKLIGSNANALKLKLEKDGYKFTGISFSMDLINKFDKEIKKLDIVYSVEANEYPAKIFNIQLNIVDFRPSEVI